METYLKFLSIALLLYYIGELSWDIMDWVLGTTPYPSIADMFWVAGYVAEGLTLIFLLMHFQAEFVTSMKLVWSMVVLSAITVYGAVVSLFILNLEQNPIILLFDFFYLFAPPILTVLALSTLLVVWKFRLGLPWVAITAGNLIDSIAGFWYIFLEYEEAYYTGHFVDLLFAFAYVVYAYGVYLTAHRMKLYEGLFEESDRSARQPLPLDVTDICVLCHKPLSSSFREREAQGVRLHFCSDNCLRVYDWLINVFTPYFLVGKETLQRPNTLSNRVLEFKFNNIESEAVFDYLTDAFIEEYMKRKIVVDKAGWRSLVQVLEAVRIPKSRLYGPKGRPGKVLTELLRRGVVETAIFPGVRGRGGEALKVRISYSKEPVQRYVDQIVARG